MWEERLHWVPGNYYETAPVHLGLLRALNQEGEKGVMPAATVNDPEYGETRQMLRKEGKKVLRSPPSNKGYWKTTANKQEQNASRLGSLAVKVWVIYESSAYRETQRGEARAEDKGNMEGMVGGRHADPPQPCDQVQKEECKPSLCLS